MIELVLVLLGLCLVGAALAAIAISKWADDRLGRIVGDLPTSKPLPTLSTDAIKSMHNIRAAHIASQCKTCRECGCRCQGKCVNRSAS